MGCVWSVVWWVWYGLRVERCVVGVEWVASVV